MKNIKDHKVHRDGRLMSKINSGYRDFEDELNRRAQPFQGFSTMGENFEMGLWEAVDEYSSYSSWINRVNDTQRNERVHTLIDSGQIPAEQAETWRSKVNGPFDYKEATNWIRANVDLEDEIETNEELLAIRNEEMDARKAYRDSFLDRSTPSGKAAYFAGGFGSIVLDIPVMLTGPIAAPIRGSVQSSRALHALSMARQSAKGGLITQAALEPIIHSWQEDLGREYTISDSLFNIAASGIFAAGLTGTVAMVTHASQIKSQAKRLKRNQELQTDEDVTKIVENARRYFVDRRKNFKTLIERAEDTGRTEQVQQFRDDMYNDELQYIKLAKMAEGGRDNIEALVGLVDELDILRDNPDVLANLKDAYSQIDEATERANNAREVEYEVVDPTDEPEYTPSKTESEKVTARKERAEKKKEAKKTEKKEGDGPDKAAEQTRKEETIDLLQDIVQSNHRVDGLIHEEKLKIAAAEAEQKSIRGIWQFIKAGSEKKERIRLVKEIERIKARNEEIVAHNDMIKDPLLHTDLEVVPKTPKQIPPGGTQKADLRVQQKIIERSIVKMNILHDKYRSFEKETIDNIVRKELEEKGTLSPRQIELTIARNVKIDKRIKTLEETIAKNEGILATKPDNETNKRFRDSILETNYEIEGEISRLVFQKGQYPDMTRSVKTPLGMGTSVKGPEPRRPSPQNIAERHQENVAITRENERLDDLIVEMTKEVKRLRTESRNKSKKGKKLWAESNKPRHDETHAKEKVDRDYAKTKRSQDMQKARKMMDEGEAAGKEMLATLKQISDIRATKKEPKKQYKVPGAGHIIDVLGVDYETQELVRRFMQAQAQYEKIKIEKDLGRESFFNKMKISLAKKKPNQLRKVIKETERTLAAIRSYNPTDSKRAGDARRIVNLENKIQSIREELVELEEFLVSANDEDLTRFYDETNPSGKQIDALYDAEYARSIADANEELDLSRAEIVDMELSPNLEETIMNYEKQGVVFYDESGNKVSVRKSLENMDQEATKIKNSVECMRSKGAKI